MTPPELRDRERHPTLQRLDDLAVHLSGRPDVVAVLGLGSAGIETDRFDDHSDLDVFVVVDHGAVERYVNDLDWLEAPCPVAYSFANEHHGRKALYADGVFVEYAVFTIDEVSRLAFTGARVIWQREGAPSGLAAGGPPPPGPPFDTVEFHLNEALTNLYVGLHRELRGERLTATRFIQSFAVDRVLALLRLTSRQPGHRHDVFEASRRIEQAYRPDQLPLAAMLPGYDANGHAARTILSWLRERFRVDHAIADAIEELIARTPSTAPRHRGQGAGR